MTLPERRVECEMGLERSIIDDMADCEEVFGCPGDGSCNEIGFVPGGLSGLRKIKSGIYFL